MQRKIIPIGSIRKISNIFGYGNLWARTGRSHVPLQLSRVSYLRRRTLHESRYRLSPERFLDLDASLHFG